MMILQACSRSKAVRIWIEGVLLDLASVFGQQTAMRPQLCRMESQYTVEDAVTRRRYVRGAGRPMIALALTARLPYEG